ncbi:MAG: hypothetical protein RLZZ494_2330, partial [Pseudomonadota bacterium]
MQRTAMAYKNRPFTLIHQPVCT